MQSTETDAINQNRTKGERGVCLQRRKRKKMDGKGGKGGKGVRN